MPKFRKKPVVIEAMQLPEDNRAALGENPWGPRGDELTALNRAIAVWMAENGYDGNPNDEDITEWPENETHLLQDGVRVGLAEFGINYIEIETLEGTMMARPGDWVIKGVQGEFYPCKPDIFESTYEEVL